MVVLCRKDDLVDLQVRLRGGMLVCGLVFGRVRYIERLALFEPRAGSELSSS